MASERAALLVQRLREAAANLIALIEPIDDHQWRHIAKPGVWSIGKDAEHVADAAGYHQWIVRLTIGQKVSSRRPAIERKEVTTRLAPRDAVELIRQRTDEGARLIADLTDEQLSLPTRPPRAGQELLAGTIERVLIGHYDAPPRGHRGKASRSGLTTPRATPTPYQEGARVMSLSRVQFFSVSLDGFGTGDVQSLEAPFGHAGERLHEWMFLTRWWHERVGETGGSGGIDDAFLRLHDQRVGAEIMGSGKFGPPGWHENPEWKGWWGPNPPFHTPTFILTHHPRPSIEMEGGTTFHFIDASPAEALKAAREAAGGQDVRLGGGVTIDPRLPCCRARRPHAHRGGPDPARSRRTPLGRTRGPREGLRDRGNLLAQRRDARDLRPRGCLSVPSALGEVLDQKLASEKLSVPLTGVELATIAPTSSRRLPPTCARSGARCHRPAGRCRTATLARRSPNRHRRPAPRARPTPGGGAASGR